MSLRQRLVHVATVDLSLETLLGLQLRAFRDAGYEVFAASAPGPFVATLEAAGVTHVALNGATRSISVGSDARFFAGLVRMVRRLRPDIVHTHNLKPGLYGRIAARALRVPAVVNTVHGLYAQPGDPRAKRAMVYGIERVAAACSHAELVQNGEDLEALAGIGVPRRRLHLLGNGVDLDRFGPDRLSAANRAALRSELGAGPDDVLVGAVGRLVREKGYTELFAAADRLRSTDPQVRFAVVGPEDSARAEGIAPSVIERAKAAGVTFLGFRDDMERLYGAFDIFVLPSYREGFPRSAMEAAASGLPLVLTDIRGCREVVEHGVNGLLVPPRDAGALARAIATLAGDEARRRALGRASVRRAAAEFDQRRVIQRTLDVYQTLLARQPAPSPVGVP